MQNTLGLVVSKIVLSLFSLVKPHTPFVVSGQGLKEKNVRKLILLLLLFFLKLILMLNIGLLCWSNKEHQHKFWGTYLWF